MLMGDWTLPDLHASFSGASEAQLKGPIKPVYPNVPTSTASPSARLNFLRLWRQVPDTVLARKRVRNNMVDYENGLVCIKGVLRLEREKAKRMSMRIERRKNDDI
jgi:hypothetical protein